MSKSNFVIKFKCHKKNTSTVLTIYSLIVTFPGKNRILENIGTVSWDCRKSFTDLKSFVNFDRLNHWVSLGAVLDKNCFSLLEPFIIENNFDDNIIN